MYLNTINKKKFLIKLISLISLCLIFIPSDKFSLPYVILILIGLIHNLLELRFSLDLFSSLISIIGFIMVFNTKKYIILAGYLLASFLIPVFLYYRIGKLDVWFWLPFLVFAISSCYSVYLQFKKK